MMNIEMHATLVHENEESYPLLVNQLDRSTKRDGYSYSYEMSHEDFYIYMLVHNSNHFRIGGMGARMVLDSYVFLKNHQSELDYDYLNVMLEKSVLQSMKSVCVRLRSTGFQSHRLNLNLMISKNIFCSAVHSAG